MKSTKKLTPYAKAWITRRAKAAKAKTKTSAKAKSQAKNKAKKPAVVLNAAQKAWITRRAKATKPVVCTNGAKYAAAPAYNVKAQVKQVKGIIAATPVTGAALNTLIVQAQAPVKAVAAVTPVVPPVKSVAELYNVGDRWIKKYSAINADGTYASSINDPKAAKFCLSGAIHRVYGNDAVLRADAFRKVEQVIKGYSLGNKISVVGFNDAEETTLTDIRRVVAIAGV